MEGDNMAGERREGKTAVLQKGGNAFPGDTKGRGRERGCKYGGRFAQEESLTRPRTGEPEVLSVAGILQTCGAQNLRFWKCATLE